MFKPSHGSGVHVCAARFLLVLLAAGLTLGLADAAWAHGVAASDQEYIRTISGVHILPFIYLGAKHMVTGYDHLLFLFAVIFFLYRPKHIAIYVSLFALGHSTTMLLGVYFGWQVNAHLVDAVIGASVVYKALDNLGAFQRWFGFQPDTKLATLIFGFIHGLGLATKVLDYEISPDGLLANLIAFNVGVEIGQILALSVILIVMGYWRKTKSFWRQAYTANVVIMSMGFILMGYQIAGYFVSTSS
ncbi:MAG: HupE/UreJ family protein [Pseudomonadota bacterium]